MRNWYVGMARDLEVAESELHKKGAGVFVARRFERVSDGRKAYARATLRFPGYVFVACAPNETGAVAKTRGMAEPALIGGAQPLVMRPGIIPSLRHLENVEFFEASGKKAKEPRKDIIPGDLVQIDGDRDHVAWGHKGHYLGTERGVASVLAGIAVWKVAEADLKRVEPERKAA